MRKTCLDNKKRRQAAFTLVEVTIASAVLATVFASIFATATICSFVTGTSRENLRATQIMLDKMEGIRLLSPSQLTNTSFLQMTFTNWFYETNNIGQANAQGTGVQYSGNLSITSVPFTNTYSSNMYEITVTVNWTSGGAGNIPHTRSMSTFYAINGLYNYVW